MDSDVAAARLGTACSTEVTTACNLCCGDMTDTGMHDNHFGQLMQAAQAGEADAYIQLLEEITPRIRQIVRRRRRFLGAGDIEDLVQDVLLSIHAVRATYD